MTSSSALTLNHHSTGVIGVIGPLGCLTENVGAVAHPDAAPGPGSSNHRTRSPPFGAATAAAHSLVIMKGPRLQAEVPAGHRSRGSSLRTREAHLSTPT